VKTNYSVLGNVQLAYAIDRVLPLVTGGVGFADVTSVTLNAPVGPARQEVTVDHGLWTVGFGIDHAVTNALAIGMRYKYVDKPEIHRFRPIQRPSQEAQRMNRVTLYRDQDSFRASAVDAPGGKVHEHGCRKFRQCQVCRELQRRSAAEAPWHRCDHPGLLGRHRHLHARRRLAQVAASRVRRVPILGNPVAGWRSVAWLRTLRLPFLYPERRAISSARFV
jgi:hypothetical protein